MGVSADFLPEDLLDGELDLLDLDLAVAVVDFQVALGVLIRREHVLVERGLELGRALGAAAPRLDLRSFVQLDVLLQAGGLLANDEHCLVPHVLTLANEHRLAEVLDLGLGRLAVVLIGLEHE